MIRTLPQEFKLPVGAAPETTNGGKTADYVSLRNALWAWVHVILTQAVGHATAFTLNKATAVDGTGAVALTTNVQVWANEDGAASDALVKKADAKAYTVAADIKKKHILFGIDPATLGDTFDVITVISADSSQATNFWTVLYELDTKYKQATPPSAIVD